jgi:hypothetical protein
MDPQDDSAADFQLDERAGGNLPAGRGSEFELEECRWLGWNRQGSGSPSPPVHERLVGYPALAAESSSASIVVLKIPDDAGPFLVGVACA